MGGDEGTGIKGEEDGDVKGEGEEYTDVEDEAEGIEAKAEVEGIEGIEGIEEALACL